MARILGGRSSGKTYDMIKNLEEYLSKIEKPKEQRVYINSNKISLNILKDINFYNVDYIITTLLPDDIAFCIVNKEQFDNFDNYFRKEELM